MLKTLANCKPSEFLKQSNAIRKSVEEWLTVTDIENIRNRLPHKELPTVGMTTEEKSALEVRNREAEKEQMKANMSAILDAVLEDHAEETLKVLALCCFVEPKDVDKHPMSMYIEGFNQLINDESVMSFFISLARLGRTFSRNA